MTTFSHLGDDLPLPLLVGPSLGTTAQTLWAAAVEHRVVHVQILG